MRRPRLPSADEAALWRNYVRDVAPLGRDPAEAVVPVPAPVASPKQVEPAQAAPIVVKRPAKPVKATAKAGEPIAKAPAAAVPPVAHRAVMTRPFEKPVVRRADRTGPVDIDRRSWQRLHRGEMVVESRLDLHGLTQMAAYDRLAAFIDHAWRVGSRCVLVITGRGSADVGILRTMTPRWLDEIPMRDKVLAYAQAKTHHGGAGALYVLIRRRRVD